MKKLATSNSGLLRVLGWSSAIAILLWLGLYNQPFYPVTWLDEGMTLQGAINLVQFGQYAMRSSEGFRVFDQPLMANGPGVVLPISISFMFFGVGLLQARLVILIFFIGTAVVYYSLSKRLFGAMPAIISTFLLLALPAEGFLIYGRQALGMVPSLGYFLLGYMLWLKALDHNRWIYTTGTGLLFSLAMITKGQYMLVIPTIMIVVLLDKLYFRSNISRKLLQILGVIFACLALWYLIQIIVLGWDRFLLNMGALSGSSKVTIFALRGMRIPGSLWYLNRSGILLVLLPGWFLIAWYCLVRKQASSRYILLLVLIPIWLAWFTLISLGWQRYAFDPFAVGAIFSGAFIWESFRLFGNHATKLPFPPINRHILRAARLLSAFILLFSIYGFIGQVRMILASPNKSPQELAAYLIANVRPDQVIESWEWEIDALAPLTYHHPTNDWVDKLTGALHFDEEVGKVYAFSAHQPEFLINGPFSKWTGFYDTFLAENCCSLMASFGLYDLYRLAPTYR
jgi:4-amino-4-deoxy-L-arabinose transferase-like glycosyltransferase